jgi:hypothetical protein
MMDLLPKLRIASIVLHVGAALALLVLLSRAGVTAGWCIFPGVLIACGSVPTMPGRPVTLYVSFGILMGYAFWLAVSAINLGEYLTLVPALLIVVGSAWLLNEPAWASAIFTWVAVAFCLGLTILLHQNRFNYPADEIESIGRTVATSAVVLVVGLLYSLFGFAEMMLKKTRKRKTRAIRTPTGPPRI